MRDIVPITAHSSIDTRNTEKDHIATRQKAVDEVISIICTLPLHTQDEVIGEVITILNRNRNGQIDRVRKELNYLQQHKDITRRRRYWFF